jgi:hypothetical protein
MNHSRPAAASKMKAHRAMAPNTTELITPSMVVSAPL